MRPEKDEGREDEAKAEARKCEVEAESNIFCKAEAKT